MVTNMVHKNKYNIYKSFNSIYLYKIDRCKNQVINLLSLLCYINNSKFRTNVTIMLQALKCCRIDFINLLQISENLKIKKCKFAIFSKNLMALKSRCINNFKYLIDVSIKLHSLPDQIFGFSYKSESLKIGNGANFFALRVVFIYYIILYYYIYKQEKKI